MNVCKIVNTNAMAENWTRVDCLEGNHANHYTTKAKNTLSNTFWLRELA